MGKSFLKPPTKLATEDKISITTKKTDIVKNTEKNESQINAGRKRKSSDDSIFEAQEKANKKFGIDAGDGKIQKLIPSSKIASRVNKISNLRRKSKILSTKPNNLSVSKPAPKPSVVPSKINQQKLPIKRTTVTSSVYKQRTNISAITVPVANSHRPAKPTKTIPSSNVIKQEPLKKSNTAPKKLDLGNKPEVNGYESDDAPPPLPRGSNIDFKIRSIGFERVAKYWENKYQKKKIDSSSKDSKIDEFCNKVDEISKSLENSRKTLIEKETKIKSLEDQIYGIGEERKREKQEYIDKKKDMENIHKNELEKTENEKAKLYLEIETLKSNIESIEQRLLQETNDRKKLEVDLQTLKNVYQNTEELLRTTKMNLETTQSLLDEKVEKIKELEDVISQRDNSISELNNSLQEEEKIRRKLHNTIQELKGNIRVFCRSRPLTETGESKENTCLGFDNESKESKSINIVQEKENATGKSKTISTEFEFDRVFLPNTSQDEVYEEVSQLIQSALDGYSVCIFAYGQTGSGKTFTMEGPDNPSKPDMGVIPRALEQIYSETIRLQTKGWNYKLSAQFVEIYNEQLYDLLSDPSTMKGVSVPGTAKKRGTRSAASKDNTPKLEIRQEKDGHVYISGCSKISVDTPESIGALLKKAKDNRRVAATLCNERSSRSHCVFTLFVSGENSLTKETVSCNLNLIDLAGSERLSSSGSVGERLKETQAINKSLSCLGDVIFALANSEKHVPYRNCKLTHMLMPSLGAGNSKTLMFVCVSPSVESSQETLCSLRFAAKVNSCHIGTAKKQG
ncbi:hypothetical protein BB559_003360 [Furculomyces boomerangus]|uniref:Kinesin motor domain-containing protein n=1 Tax=Furculomyces boomerangus TaxID=61424 RepID=A0A2T9YLS3_9FUNG|nr:hypothetical protein BB559_003360 [Furculomyces boomerangus]